MLYDEQQGHDAQIDAIAIDVLGRTVTLRLSAYANEESPKRDAIEIIFRDVEQVQSIADMIRLEKNRGAGNVNHWHVADGPGSSFFYFVEGCLVVTAGTAPTVRTR